MSMAGNMQIFERLFVALSTACALSLAFALAYAPATAWAGELSVSCDDAGNELVSNQVVVELSDEVGLAELEEFAGEGLFSIAEVTQEAADAPTYALLETPADISVDEAIEALEQQDAVESAQPNHVYHLYDDESAQGGPSSLSSAGGRVFTLEASGTGDDASDGAGGTATGASAPNDPEAQEGGRLYDALRSANMFAAWQLVKTQGSVTIAIVDSGCDLTHPDLAANVIAEAAYNVFDGSADVTDVSTHGTHVAGIAAGAADNDLGIAGTSYNARFIPVKAVDDYGRITSFNACKAFTYLAGVADAHPEYNIRVVNMSFGGKMSSADSDDQATIRAIEELVDRGILPVCAAGNTDASHDEIPPYRSWPGDFSENILSVINADGDVRAGASNYNIDGQLLKAVCAPGTNIYSTVPNGDYGEKSGTSMASPFVAGIAALLFADNPSLSPAQVAQALRSSARDLGPTGFDAETGFGMVDAEGAVKALRNGDYLIGPHSVLAGESIQIAAASNAGELIWTSSNTAVAQVDASGCVSGLGEGTAIISAQAGDETMSFPLTVLAPQVSAPASLKAGASATCKVKSSQPGVWCWASSDESVALVGDSGRVQAVAPGTATITASLSSNPGVFAQAEITVSPATIDLSEADVSMEASFAYTGSVITPRPVVSLQGTTLRAGTDYKLGYTNNIGPGTAQVTITGAGEYSGSITRNFTITAPINKAKAASIGSKTYTGKQIKPAVSLAFNGKTLKAGTDYTLSYSQNIKVGTATITAKGKGCYTGSKSVTFKIVKAANPMKVTAKAKTKAKALAVASATVSKKNVAIAAKKAFAVTKAQGKVTYKKASGNAKIAVAANGKITVKKGLAKGTYAVKVNITANGNANYKAKTVKSQVVYVKVK